MDLGIFKTGRGMRYKVKKERFFPLATFVLIFLVHGIYSLSKLKSISSQCVLVEDSSWLTLYFKGQDFLMGYSFALVAAFTVYALIKCFQKCGAGFAGVVGGITLSGLLYFVGCILIGCCGSPLLAVYLGFLGASVLKFAKPLIAIITTFSIALGFLWIKRKDRTCCIKNKNEVSK